MERMATAPATARREYYGGVPGVRRSFEYGQRRPAPVQRETRPIRYGDRIFVRIVNMQQGWRTIADFSLCNVSDLTEVYGELRWRTRGERGLTRLYIRNATRGWCYEQPFMLYGERRPTSSAAGQSAPSSTVTVRDCKDQCCDSPKFHWQL